MKVCGPSTVFASDKLPLKTYLAAVALFSNAVNGISALQLARELGVQHKTAFVLSPQMIGLSKNFTPTAGNDLILL